MSRSEQRLEDIVKSVLHSYHSHPDLERIGQVRLPTKEDVVALVEDIEMLLFPGFLRSETLDTLTLPYVIGQKTGSIFHRLSQYLGQVLCWESGEKSDCMDDPQFKQKVENISLEFLEALPDLRDILADDVHVLYEGDPAARSRQEIVISYPGIQAITVHRIAHFFYKKGIPLLPRMMSEFVHSKTGVDIHPGATLGRGTMIDHGTGIVIGETTEIGDYVRIYQGVTLGALSPRQKMNSPLTKRHPTIEDHVVIYAGATILGGTTRVGAHSIIGGNVWLTHSVPPRSRVIGQTQESSQTRTEDMLLCYETGANVS